MIGDLPKIFDRNFVVGYLLPSAVYLAFSLGIVHCRSLLNPTDMVPSPPAGVMFFIFAFALGIVLLTLNRIIIRILEGYDRFNPVRLMMLVQRGRFRRLCKELEDADKKFTDIKAKMDQSDKKNSALEVVMAERSRLMLELAEHYPDKEESLLPSRFGNAVRAFESYPLEMYGLDAIEGWTRLLAVIPEQFLRKVDIAKSEVDLWINMWALSIVTIIDVVATWYWPSFTANINRAAFAGVISHPLTIRFLYGTVIASTALALISSKFATKAAIEWGSTIKAAIDVFLPVLYDRLGFEATSDNETVQRQWRAFSQAITFRRPDVMPNRRWTCEFTPSQTNTERTGNMTGS